MSWLNNILDTFVETPEMKKLNSLKLASDEPDCFPEPTLNTAYDQDCEIDNGNGFYDAACGRNRTQEEIDRYHERCREDRRRL